MVQYAKNAANRYILTEEKMVKWFNNLKISTKLFLCFTAVLILLVLNGVVGYLGVRTANQKLVEISEVRLPAIDYLVEADRDLQQSDERWKKFTQLAIIPKYNQARAERMRVSRQIVDGRREDTREGRRMAIDLCLTEARDKFEQMRDSINEL